MALAWLGSGGRGESWGVIGGPGGDLLFRTLRCSTIGAEGFHGRVRDGIGCLAPRYGHQAGQAPLWVVPLWVVGRGGDVTGKGSVCMGGRRSWALGAERGGGARRDRGCAGVKPIERLVPVSCAGCPASTSGLSTWWSSTALNETWF